MSTSTSAGPKKPIDPDEFFQHTRMSLGDHLEELSGALWRSIYGLGFALIFGFIFAKSALEFVARPVEGSLEKFHEERRKKEKAKFDEKDPRMLKMNEPSYVPMRYHKAELLDALGFTSKDLPADSPRRKALDDLGVDATKVDPNATVDVQTGIAPVDMEFAISPANHLVTKPPRLSTLSPTEAFVIWIKMGFYLGVVLSSPWIFYQIWMFVAAGLYPHEKKYVHLYLPVSLGLFLGGVLLCEFVALPLGLDYLLAFNAWLDMEPDLRLSEWLSFALLMPLVFGLAFQTPMVMLFLERLGICTVETYIRSWRMAIFIILLISALLSVSPDPTSVAVLAVPMLLLYGAGIVLCRVLPRGASDLGDPSGEETVEV